MTAGLVLQWREQANTVECPEPRCAQPPGATCLAADGLPMVHIAAHLRRMRQAGVEMAPTTPEELNRDMKRMQTPEMADKRMQANRAEADRYRRETLAKQATERRTASAQAMREHTHTPLPPEPTDDEEAQVIWLRGPQGR